MKTVTVSDGVVIGVVSYLDAPGIAVQAVGGDPVVVDDNVAVDVGWTYDGTGFTPRASTPVYRKRLSPPEFLLQFTPQERISIRAAAAYAGNDTAKTATAAVLSDWLAIVNDVRLTTVDLTRADTIAGVNYLVTVGILTTERAAAVLAGIVG